MAFFRLLQIQYIIHLTLAILPPLITTLAASLTSNVTLPNCTEKCGDITIPYPFGFGTSPNCYREGFNIFCNESTTPHRAFLGDEGSNIEIKDINITAGEIRVYKYIAFQCYNWTNETYANNSEASMDLTDTPFLFSSRRNKFTVIGCDTLAYIRAEPTPDNTNQAQLFLTGCYSFCQQDSIADGDGSCNGLGCCQTSILAELQYYEVEWGSYRNLAWRFNPCMYAVLVEEDWFKFQNQNLNGSSFLDSNRKGVPAVLDWEIKHDGKCLNGIEIANSSKPACLSKYSICQKKNHSDGYLCQCLQGYEGNPYIPNGCKDIDECKHPEVYPCKGDCTNKYGSYECRCKRGKKGDGKAGNCTDIIPYPAQVAIGSILGIAIFMGLCFLVAGFLQHKQHTKEKEAYRRYYQVMDNQLRVFSEKQIEMATENFGETHVIGAGGQGRVYRGLLENNQIVAIKKAKEVEETQRDEFVNEILLLSQINHKNIVKLLGCCLEVRIPMLVYEFVPNGTLYELLHEGNKRPISLGTRLKIASESAEALDYLHSSTVRTILHGDVKSANILLDDEYHAKVSDFGASNLVPINDTEVVKVVQGTRGYLDPEYVATAVLTKKSDVYSFGVVILELITRKCAIFTDETNERKHLASCFISNVSNNKLHEFLDEDIVSTNEMAIDVFHEVSKLAVWCLSVRGEDRPTMRQVKEKLQNLVNLYNSVLGPEAVEVEKQSLLSASTYHTPSNSTAFHSTGGGSVLEIESGVPR